MKREVRAAVLLVYRDLPASLVPGVGAALGGWRHSGRSAEDLLPVLLVSVAYFGLYIYSFCAGNQLTGRAEDVVNKPNRPLASGLVSVAWLRRRLVAATVLFLVVGIWFGVTEWCVLWIVLCGLYNFAGWHRHWSTRILFIGVGTVSLVAAGWQLATPLDDLAWRWIGVIAVVGAVTITVQDFRDVDGDVFVGRRTAPMVVGDTTLRVVTSASCLLVPLVVHLTLTAPTGSLVRAFAVDAVVGSLAFLAGYRLLRHRNPSADHATYLILTWCYSAICSSAVLIL